MGSVLPYSDKVKAATLDKILSHLGNVIETEPRRRERLRAAIATKNITRFLKQADQELSTTDDYTWRSQRSTP